LNVNRSYIGGNFAPPLSDEKLAAYTALVAGLKPSPVRDAMTSLLRCCAKWWELPEPAGTAARAHPSGRGVVVPLAPGHAKDLDDLIPWGHELKAAEELLDGIDPVGDKALRDAAFHLLWHVKELDLGREPLTNDLI
jgi:hypothetical protein